VIVFVASKIVPLVSVHPCLFGSRPLRTKGKYYSISIHRDFFHEWISTNSQHLISNKISPSFSVIVIHCSVGPVWGRVFTTWWCSSSWFCSKAYWRSNRSVSSCPLLEFKLPSSTFLELFMSSTWFFVFPWDQEDCLSWQCCDCCCCCCWFFAETAEEEYSWSDLQRLRKLLLSMSDWVNIAMRKINASMDAWVSRTSKGVTNLCGLIDWLISVSAQGRSTRRPTN
jgi:hypothetical protein